MHWVQTPPVKGRFRFVACMALKLILSLFPLDYMRCGKRGILGIEMEFYLTPCHCGGRALEEENP